MLKSDLVQTDKHSTKICSGGKISDFSVAQIIFKLVAKNSRIEQKSRKSSLKYKILQADKFQI